MQYKTLFMQQLLQFQPSVGALNEPDAILTNHHWKTFISFSTVSLPSAKFVWLAIRKLGNFMPWSTCIWLERGFSLMF